MSLSDEAAAEKRAERDAYEATVAKAAKENARKASRVNPKRR
jgi:hypothetical protein